MSDRLCIFITCVVLFCIKNVLLESNITQELLDESLDQCSENCTDSDLLIEDPLEYLDLNATDVDAPIGLGVDRLGLNESEIVDLLANDTEVESFDVGDITKGKIGLGGSYIFPILNATEYDKNAAPSFISDQAVRVLTSLYFVSLSNFDSRRQEFTADVELLMQWRDIRLMHNYSSYILVKEPDIIQRLWRPDPFFVNEKHAYLHKVTFPNTRMLIRQNGVITYIMRLSLVPACPMVFCLYPHDPQSCYLKIGSIAYSQELVQIAWFDQNAVLFNPEIALPELQYVNHTVSSDCSIHGKISNSSCLLLQLNLQRGAISPLLEKYMPSIFAVAFAWVAPYVPISYSDIRIVQPITVLLTLAAMQRGSENLPRTSYLTAMDVWFTAMKAFTVISLLETVVVIALARKAETMKKRAERAKTAEGQATIKKEGKKLARISNRIDVGARIVPPIIFTVWFLVYFYMIYNYDQYYCVSSR